MSWLLQILSSANSDLNEKKTEPTVEMGRQNLSQTESSNSCPYQPESLLVMPSTFLSMDIPTAALVLEWSMIICGVFTFLTTFVIKAPYGRYAPFIREKESGKWGPLLPATLGW